jgi:hypothetical protein
VNLFTGAPAAVVNPGEDGQHGGGEPCGGPLAQAVAVREVNAPKIIYLEIKKKTFVFLLPRINIFVHYLQTKEEQVTFLLLSVCSSISGVFMYCI